MPGCAGAPVSARGVRGLFFPIAFLVLLLPAGARAVSSVPAHAAPALSPDPRGTVLADFDSGQVDLASYDPQQDQDPNGWELTQDNAHGGSGWSLRLFGNTWKSQPVSSYPVTRETVFQVAAYVEETGEMNAFGVSDGTNTLFYTFAGTELPTSDPWEATYQGAFPIHEWQLYMLPVGRDWYMRYGYDPAITSLVYVNDRDNSPRGTTLFDDVVDVTSDLPIAPQVEIVRGRQETDRISERLWRVGIQFHAQVYDPDSDSLSYHWDFGDSTFSSEADPYHEYLVHADYTYTVDLAVRDDTGLWGRDSAQVRVEPGTPTSALNVNFVGDVMLARGYDQPGGLVDTYGPEHMFTPTLPVYGEDADLNVCNLECPFTTATEHHPTKSIFFKARPSNIAGVVYAGIDVVSVGNNHIMDYLQPGMDETFQVLDGAQIRWSGAGDNDYMAEQPTFWNEQGVAVAFLGQCNRTGREYNYQPFLDAAYNKPGFAWLTEANLVDAIGSARPLADLVVAQFHAGIEYTTDPGTVLEPLSPISPGDVADEDGVEAAPGAAPGTAPGAAPGGPSGLRLVTPPGPMGIPLSAAAGIEPPFDAQGPQPGQAVIHFPTRPSLSDRQLRWRAVEAGADLVICHHPHVLQGFEAYHGVLIAHSLGNFVFDQTYAETMPTLILKAEFDKEGFRNFTFRPAFVDDWVPHPVSGRLGREILDRQADYSRELGTIVTVDPVAMQGRIYVDSTLVVWSPSDYDHTAPLVQEDTWYTTPPIERPGPGTLSRVLSVQASGTVQVRVGREILWHGDMEDEGATFWNLNSSSETYDESIFHQGHRSLRQTRTSNNTGQVQTDLEGYPPTLGGTEFSLCGWLKTQDAHDAGFSARFFQGRGGNPVQTTEVAPLIQGTHDWTFLWTDFQVPENAAFFNVRPHMDRPESGQCVAWFDELRLIEWEPWQDGAFPIEVPRPSNLRYLQVRVSQPADSVALAWEDVRGADVPNAVSPGPGSLSPAQARLSLSTPVPNPARGSTLIEYSLPRSARVRLMVVDVAGRRIAVLADETQKPGLHGVLWRTDGIPSGLYFCRIEAGGEARTRKVVVLK